MAIQAPALEKRHVSEVPDLGYSMTPRSAFEAKKETTILAVAGGLRPRT